MSKGTAPDSAAETKVSSGTPLILVIDDNDLVRRVVVDMVRSLNYRVIEADSGERALTLVERLRPALAICDLVLPDSDGADIARRARAIRPEIAIVFLSGYFDALASGDVAGALSLRKPVDIEALDRTIRTLLV